MSHPIGHGHLPSHPGHPPRALGPAPRNHRQNGAGTVVALLVMGLLLLVVVGVVGVEVGADALPAAVLLAFVPLTGVMAAVRWVDRWEPEPWPALAVAFGWGASVSVLVALVLNTGAIALLVASGSSEWVASAYGATVVAPVVEESIKALGVLLIFLVWRRHFDGPVDGLVYAATVAAGFAFVENVLYFGTALAEVSGPGQAIGPGVATVFVLRAVLSPFAHLLFTACVGIGLGLAARHRSRSLWLLTFPLGLLVAVLLHGLWNGSAVLSTEADFFLLYVVVQMPIFFGVVGLVAWLRRREAAIVRLRLTEYAAAQWFAPAEVSILASLGERRRAVAWASRQGGRAAGRAMRRFQTVATRLAFQRQRLLTHREDLRTVQDEAALLGDLLAARQELRRTLAV
ncbi:PrsW family intramembrane metalloprotease [Actinotalea sp. K2]|uniref:PrsW family glutamic-type intramembrane protease n=1 Tax=Actinotalea sp. K2 TaxID=2939438 RepID=UPI0020170C11|nr:PrsW family intramembrane metalloprotease [Actinotalea sp. K2]MCL3862309.1 PrsW family intramembrane metalloprotease [Actinotalea sp. K2]